MVAEGDADDPGVWRFKYAPTVKNLAISEGKRRGKDNIITDVNVDEETGYTIGGGGVWEKIRD